MNQMKMGGGTCLVAFLAVLVLAFAMAFAFTGCVGDGDAARVQARRDVAAVLRVAYDVGGKAAVASKIDALVDDGKLTPAQGEALKAFAAEACEEMLRRLDGGCVGAIDCSDCGECGDCGEKGPGGGDAVTDGCGGCDIK